MAEGESGVEVEQSNFVSQGKAVSATINVTEKMAGVDIEHIAPGRVTEVNTAEKLDYLDPSGLQDIYCEVLAGGGHNYIAAKVPVPSGLHIPAWRANLEGYWDQNVTDFLEFGWPANYSRQAAFVPTYENHPSAKQFMGDVEFYLNTERGHRAVAGPFRYLPFTRMQISPLMTRPKKDSQHRRVIVDLSWPQGASINDAIDEDWYVDGPARVRLPTVAYMEGRIRELGRGAYLYKTDLSRGYRQLRVDPQDWPMLGFTFRGEFYFDVCPPFGMRTSSLCMQRTSEAISWVHGQRGYVSRPYLDDFGGAEGTEKRAFEALRELQAIMRELGVQEAAHKVCEPAQCMTWLGLSYDTLAMTISVPQIKLEEIMGVVRSWEKRVRATRRQMQQLLGLLQFVASVSPPTRIFSNRMLQNLRDMPKWGSHTLSLGFKKDLKFFLDVLPDYNGVRILEKDPVPAQETLELDACLTGCGAFANNMYYAEEFPEEIQQAGHTIAHLEMLNVVVAIKIWRHEWAGHTLSVRCDNMNTCLAIASGRSKDPYMQHCIRELFVYCVRHDIEMTATHQEGRTMVRADALSRMHVDRRCKSWVQNDTVLAGARRVRVPREAFRLLSDC